MTDLPIPASAIEAAMRASYDAWPQFTGAGSDRRPKSYEECYGCSPLEHKADRDEMEVALRAAFDELGMVRSIVDHRGVTTGKWRLVSKWMENDAT